MIMACFWGLVAYGACLIIDMRFEENHPYINFLVAFLVGATYFTSVKFHEWIFDNVLFNLSFFYGFLGGISGVLLLLSLAYFIVKPQ